MIDYTRGCDKIFLETILHFRKYLVFTLQLYICLFLKEVFHMFSLWGVATNHHDQLGFISVNVILDGSAHISMHFYSERRRKSYFMRFANIYSNKILSLHCASHHFNMPSFNIFVASGHICDESFLVLMYRGRFLSAWPYQ